MEAQMNNDVGLGSEAFAKALLIDLYVRLRHDLKRWASVTMQTPQPRMGYVGQHLVSVITGHPGGRSGARGDDLKLDGGKVGEIKCCYRVDQLGKCGSCGTPVASIETICPNEECKSDDLRRSDDSKWLISVKNETELRECFSPSRYYFVLFEFVDLNRSDDVDVVVYEVDPTTLGFTLCIIDYYFNIREMSRSKAPFNLWPHSAKFLMMRPRKIYHSIIKVDDTIDTIIFPGKGEADLTLEPLAHYLSSKTITEDAIDQVALLRGVDFSVEKLSLKAKIRRHEKLLILQARRELENWDESSLQDDFARAVYGRRLVAHAAWTDEFSHQL